MGFLRTAVVLLAIFLLLPCEAEAEAPIRPGDRVVIYCAEKGLASDGAVDIIFTDGVPTEYPETAVWTVEAAGENWRFLQEGQALGLTEDHATLVLGGEKDQWQLEAGSGGGYYLKTADVSVYLWYWRSRNRWMGSMDPTEIFFWVLPGVDIPEESEPDESLSFEGYQLYFGQLHGHSTASGGSNSVAGCFAQAKGDGMDFFAVTDHSQTFDGGENAQITTDANAYSNAWASGKAAAAAATDGSFVGMFGFEMAWNQGQGHASTFGTPGFFSREQDAYQSYATGMETYLDALPAGSVTQLNHPGEPYGDFKGFSAYSPGRDSRVTLLEVDGELAQFQKALAQGWTLAPTSSRGRTVVLANSLTEGDILEALRNRRAYATLDADLEVIFTLNGYKMGEKVQKSQVGENAEISVQLRDPTDSAIGRVSVIGENGTVLAESNVEASRDTLQFSLPTDQKYYYLHILQPDGDWAVTAPIYLTNQSNLGISSIKATTEVLRAGKEQTFQVTVYNNEETAFSVNSMTVTVGERAYSVEPFTVDALGSVVREVSHTFDIDGVYPVTVKINGSLGGSPRTLTKTVQIPVLPPLIVDDVIILGSGENLKRAMDLGKDRDMDIFLEETGVTGQRLEECKLLILPAPDAGIGDILLDYVNQGGRVLLWGGEQQNALLEKIGVTARFGPEIGQQVTMDFSQSPYTEGITEGQRFLQESGCAIQPGNGEILVRSGEYPLLVAEKTSAGGTVLLAGGAFCTDTYVRSSAPSVWALPTANQTIFENILGIARTKQEMIPISSLRTGEIGRIYLTEGRVTAGTANPNTTFFDTIYIQDSTGGICAGPYSQEGLALGTRVRILGVLATDQGDPCLQIIRLEALELGTPLTPETAELKVDHAGYGGKLLKVQGNVTQVQYLADGEGVSRFTLAEGENTLEILVESYIFSGSRGKNELARIVKPGNMVSAVGLLHLSEGSAVLRVRDCDEVVLLEAAPETETPEENTLPTIPTDTEDQPDTGDGKPVKLWLWLLLLSCIGIWFFAGKREN